LLEKSKLAQPAYEEGHKIFWNKERVLQIIPTPHAGNTRNQPLVSAESYNQPTHFGYLSHLDPRAHSRNKETTIPSSVVSVENLFFLGWHPSEYCFSPTKISIEIHLWCKALYV
jgi:hypothetical protein